MNGNLYSLFKRCLGAKYIETAESGDYATQIDGDTLYLLFQKSRGGRDWINNFKFGAVPYKNIDKEWRVHRGFLRVWRAMKDEVELKVEEILCTTPIKKIVVVGYSHGAALAVLATEDMVYYYGEVYEVRGYGFGGPRVIWGVVPSCVKKRLECFTLVRNIPDIVTHVPPAFLGYRHIGKKVKVGHLGKYGPIMAHTPNGYLTSLNKKGQGA